jgi:hypothetical protein
MDNNRRLLTLGVVFIIIGLAEAVVFKFSATGLTLGVVFVLVGASLLVRSRRSQV